MKFTFPYSSASEGGPLEGGRPKQWETMICRQDGNGRAQVVELDRHLVHNKGGHSRMVGLTGNCGLVCILLVAYGRLVDLVILR